MLQTLTCLHIAVGRLYEGFVAGHCRLLISTGCNVVRETSEPHAGHSKAVKEKKKLSVQNFLQYSTVVSILHYSRKQGRRVVIGGPASTKNPLRRLGKWGKSEEIWKIGKTTTKYRNIFKDQRSTQKCHESIHLSIHPFRNVHEDYYATASGRGSYPDMSGKKTICGGLDAPHSHVSRRSESDAAQTV